jgi:hypothetical protein
LEIVKICVFGSFLFILRLLLLFPFGPLNFWHIYIHHLEDNVKSSRLSRRFSLFLAVDISRREQTRNMWKTVIWVWTSRSFIPSNKKVKLPSQPIHIPTNPKQAYLSYKSTILDIIKIWVFGSFLFILRFFLLFSTWAIKLLTHLYTPSWRQCYQLKVTKAI